MSQNVAYSKTCRTWSTGALYAVAVTALLFCGCAKKSMEVRVKGPSGVLVLSHVPSEDARCEAKMPGRIFLRVSRDGGVGPVAESAMPVAALGYFDGSGRPVTVPMAFDAGEGALAAPVPAYPKWAKISYYFVVWNGGANSLVFLPSVAPGVTFATIARGNVPQGILVAHLAAMFVVLGLFTLAGIAGAVSLKTGRFPLGGMKAAGAGLVGFLIGGFALGGLCSYLTFGIPWEGFPVGRNTTDNRTLLIFVYWFALVCAYRFGAFGRPKEAPGAGARVAGAMMIFGILGSLALYFLNHSI